MIFLGYTINKENGGYMVCELKDDGSVAVLSEQHDIQIINKEKLNNQKHQKLLSLNLTSVFKECCCSNETAPAES